MNRCHPRPTLWSKGYRTSIWITAPKTKMASWKSIIFNRRHIFIHGGFWIVMLDFGGVVKFGKLKGGTEIPRCRKFIKKNCYREKNSREIRTLHNKSFPFYLFPSPVSWAHGRQHDGAEQESADESAFAASNHVASVGLHPNNPEGWQWVDVEKKSLPWTSQESTPFKSLAGWWLNQPNWKILVKLEIFPKYGWK